MNNATVTANAATGTYEGFAQGRVGKFLGIRYALPCIGEGRFSSPRPVPNSEERIVAKQYGNRNFQVGMAEAIYRDFVPPGDESEDCLFLNIFAPADFNKAKPVMVWIHGGAFTSGSGNEYDATRLARENDVVVVTINYRLGVFGFLDLRALGEEFSRCVNLGIQDQIEALRWVRQNISAFGGDPDNITIWGESAGATSVLSLLGAPDAKGLFHRCAAFSGAETLAPPFDQLPMIKQHLGIEGDADCARRLMEMSGSELSKMQQDAAIYGGPCIDGEVIRCPACEAITQGLSSHVPVICGTVRDEGTLLAPLFAASDEMAQLTLAGLAAPIGRDMGEAYFGYLQNHFAEAGALEKLTRAWFDLFRSSALRVASTATQHGAGGWVYNFEVETDFELSVTHFADIPFAFDWIAEGNPLSFIHNDSARNRELSATWSKSMVAFAREGNPNGAGLPDWPRYGPEAYASMILKKSPVVVPNPDGEMRVLYKVP